MSNDSHIELEGVVVEVLKGKFRVKTTEGNIVLAQLSGKLRQNKVRVLLEDKVKVKLSVYDLSHGFISQRL